MFVKNLSNTNAYQLIYLLKFCQELCFPEAFTYVSSVWAMLVSVALCGLLGNRSTIQLNPQLL